jgi:hypothetical protein
MLIDQARRVLLSSLDLQCVTVRSMQSLSIVEADLSLPLDSCHKLLIHNRLWHSDLNLSLQ